MNDTTKNEILKMLISLPTVLASETRKKILNLVKKKPMTISEITKSIDIKYKNVHSNVKTLEKFGYIKTCKHMNTQGQMVLVELTHQNTEQIKKKLETRLKDVLI